MTDHAVPFASALGTLIPPDVCAIGAAAVERGQIGSRVVHDLVGGLVDDLGVATSPTLLAAFAAQPGRRSVSPSSTAEHDAFTVGLLAGGLEALLGSSPALAGLVHALVAGWRERTAQLLERLRDDEQLLVTRFGVTPPVVGATPLVGGSAVLTDSAQRPFVYKHRGVSLDAALAEALRWLNGQGLRHELAVPDVVDRGTHGWMSHVAHRPPTSEADRSAYLHRTGALVALTTALGSADLHLGNVRASGASPVILDAELLIRPRRAHEVDALPEVLTSGWLPFPGFVEPSGLGCERPDAKPSRWQFVATDAVRRRPRRPSELRLRRAVVEQLVADAPILRCIGEGYAELFRVLTRRAFPVELLESTRPRVVLRPSRSYDDAMARSVDPGALASDADRVQAVEPLVSQPPPSVASHPAVAEAVCGAERASVLALHYPRFGARATDTSLWWGDQRLGTPFPMSPLDRARARLAALDDRRLSSDLATIEASLAGVIAGRVHLPAVD